MRMRAFMSGEEEEEEGRVRGGLHDMFANSMSGVISELIGQVRCDWISRVDRKYDKALLTSSAKHKSRC